ncbi:peptidylprolyl isomerase [Natronogracilivirga saccharolytica]|uniref:peptidylprolyl isomerase n=1 Tax=Natronogracilivirga saccharolytica TaxID=2812953 RepID=A0A8J7UXU3_9BACT|nr:peptidylprolyl isomerase [Natronogracilivirga saccharolytica]MBP3193719.1 peptidylprolyl isomerase [Natronogracilivirga saccharolytica]
MKRSIGASILAGLLFISGCSLFQTSRSPESDDIIVGKIDGTPVTFSELEAQYNKSNQLLEGEEDARGLEDFFELYMDYRLKLQVARDAGYMDDSEIIDELESYERQSAYPFWMERHVKDRLLDELYERSKEMVNAQHILISLPENASPSDTLQAYETLMEARDRFLEGEEDFMSLSNEYSSQQRGQSMGGDLGFFSAGWAVKPFEDAAYSLEPGEVSKPVRSSFGYHLIYVKDRIESGPNKRFSHIFYNTRNVPDPVDSVLSKAEIAYQELETGDDWHDVVERHSQDEQSRLSGGNIGWVNYGMYDPDFTDTLMTLENPGDYTRPFESEYGVHIARLDSVYQPTEEEIREELSERLQQLPRFRENERAVRDNAADVGNLRVHRENLARFEDYLRENFRGDVASISFPDSILEKTIISFNDKSWSADDYLTWLKPEISEKNNPSYQHQFADEFKNHIIDKELVSLTRSRFPEFKQLSEDYLTGLAVFRVNEDSVWTYARQDTARLKELYEANTDDYHFDTRYKFVRFSASADSTLDKVREMVDAGEPADSVRNEISNVVVRRDVTSRIESSPYDQLKNLHEGEFSEYFEYRRRRTTMYLEELMDARPMTFDEAFNKLVTDYQDIREKEWLEAMRKKYRVETYPEVLKAKLEEQDD